MSDLTIQSTSFDWTDPRQSLEMWIFSSIPWVDENGTEHGAGNEQDRIFTQRVAGVTNNTTTHRLTVPSFTITPTVNAYVGRGVRLSFWIVQVIGSSVTPIKQVPGTEAGLQIPTVLTGITSLNLVFADLIINNAPSPNLPRDGFYPNTVVDAKITANIGAGGISGLGVTARIPIFTSAMAVGSDPLFAWDNTNHVLISPAASQNFAGLVSTAAQVFAGNKNLTGVTQFQNATVNEGAWSGKGATSILFSGADSSLAAPSSSGNPSVTLQTYRSGGAQGVGDSAYNLGMYRTGGPGDSYGLSVYLKVTPDMTGFLAGQYFHEGLHAHTYLSPTNVPGSGVTVTGYHLLKTELATSNANVRGVGTQVEVVNSSGANANLGVTGNFTVALNVAGGGAWQNSIGIQFEAVKATAFAKAFYPKGDSVFGTILDLTDATFHPQGRFSANNGDSFITASTFGGEAPLPTREFAKGDQVSIDGVTWYEVASTPVSNTIPLTTAYVGTATNVPLTKIPPPLRLLRPSYITGTDQVNTYKIIGMDASNRVRLDNDGQGVFSGTNFTANNNFTNKVTIGAVSGQEQYPGLWFGSAALSLAGAAILYESGADATIINGANGVYIRVGNLAQLNFTGSGQVLPSADGQGSIGVNGTRWGLVRAVTITPGDLIFSDKTTGEELWKMHEDAEFLYVQDYRSGSDVARFDRAGNLYIKGEIRAWS